jgi:23S rRNA (pseudouridine1915-N3)-methyltransferase
MLLHIIARGKIGRSPEADMVDRYARRMSTGALGTIRVTELPDRGGAAPPVPAGPVRTVVLDERGRLLASAEFARLLERWRDDGVREARFLIGAADGHDAAQRADDLAAHAGARDAGRTVVAGGEHCVGPSLPPRGLTCG